MTNEVKKYKVVINNCYGGFGLSNEAVLWLHENYGLKYGSYSWGSGVNLYLEENLERHDPRLVKCVETLGRRADGPCANLTVVEIYTPVYRISEYDGNEDIITPLDETYIVIPEELGEYKI